MNDTGKINILKKLAEIADELDIKGFRKEANAVTKVMFRVSQFQGTNITGKSGEFTVESAKNSVIKAGEALKSAAEGVASGAMSLGSLLVATNPVFAAIDGLSSLHANYMNTAMGPYIQQIEQLKTQVQESSRKNDKQGVLNLLNLMRGNLNKISSLLAERKEAGQYTSSTADFQSTIDYAVKNKLTVRQMYDYAFRNRGGGAEAGNYANNLIAKYRTIHPDPDTALVQPTKFV